MTAVPGLTPKFPVTTVKPVFVTVVAANTAKLEAAPRLGAMPPSVGAVDDDSALTPVGKALIKKEATKTIAKNRVN